MASINLPGADEIAASCLASDIAGHAVYITGPRTGGIFSVTRVDIDSGDRSKATAVGVIRYKPTPTTCRVVVRGRIYGVLSGLTPGLAAYSQDNGTLSTTPPGNAAGRFFQPVGMALDSDVIDVQPLPPIRQRI